MHDWQRDLSDSAFEFERVVWPAIATLCGGGDLIAVESVAAEGFTKQLDILAGIDAWQVNTAKGIRGIASRVQWDDGRAGFPYHTFTVRKVRFNGSDTEYAKRLKSINEKHGWLYPHLTCQAYLQRPARAGALIAAGVAKTSDVIEMIGRGDCDTRQTTNASFWVIDWTKMRAEGFDVKVWPKAVVTPTPTQMQERVTAPSAYAIFGGERRREPGEDDE